MNPVAIFAATRWELQALRRALPTHDLATVAGVPCRIGSRDGQPYWLIQTGIGPGEAGRVAAAVLESRAVRLAVSAGFACALAPAAIGDLLIGTAVVPVGRLSGWTVQGEWAGCDQDAQSRVTTAARRAGVAARSGYLVSASTVVWLADDKRELSRQTGAAGFDMESVAIGSVAVRKGIPFAIVRTISDLVDEDLPLDFNLFLQPGGWVSGLRALFSCPSGLIALNRLRRQSRVASGQLAKVFRQWAADGFRACTGEG